MPPRRYEPSPVGLLLRAFAPFFAALLLAILAGITTGTATERALWPRPAILSAIRQVESGGRTVVPDGDGGAAIGPYQIHKDYWQDAVAAMPALGGSYQSCRDPAYAERVVEAFMRHWVPAAWEHGDAQVIARTHNGGPEGARHAATLGYWQRVRAALQRGH